MPQTNFTAIQLYRSATASAVPSAANLVVGELALNYNDGRLYYEDSGGVVQLIGAKLGSAAVATFLGTPSSANLAAAVTDETGTGALVFAGGPTHTGEVKFAAGAVGTPSLTFTGDLNTGFWSPGADTVAVSTAGTEVARYTSSGVALIGSTAARTSNDGTNTPTFQVAAVNTASGGGAAFNMFSTTDAHCAYVTLNKAAANAEGTFTAVATGDELGIIAFGGSDGTDFSEGAGLHATVNGAVSAGIVPSDLFFRVQGASGSIADRLALLNDGRFYGTALHDNAGALTGTTEQYVASGQTTLTISAGTNDAARTITILSPWTRVGNVVTVGLQFSVDPTLAATTTIVYISLPIASNFSAAGDACGSAHSTNITLEGAAIVADPAGDRLQVQFVPTTLANISFSGSATYVIL